MSRSEILGRYRVVDGRIQDPGPFQGQAIHVPYFWEAYIAGNAHDVSRDGVALFAITDEDLREFPELENRSVVRLREVGGKVTEE